MNYESMTLDDLRTEARKRRIGPAGEPGGRTSWIVLAQKGPLVAALTASDAGEPLALPLATAEAKPQGTGNTESDALALLAQAMTMLRGSGEGRVDEAKVREIARDEAIKHAMPHTLVTRDDDAKAPKLDLGLTHDAFPRVLEALRLGQVPYLIGPPGSGKTHMMHQAAKALAVAFDCPDYLYEADSFNAETPDWRVGGYKNVVDGAYIPSPFYRAVTGPGLYLGDEIDKASAHVTGAFNMALDGERASFACGLVTKHPLARFAFAGNTVGLGATPQYPDRSRLPDDFRSRFTFIRFDYDLRLEKALTLAANPEAGDWLARVREVRKAAAKAGVPLTVSPRASVGGARLLAAGWTQEDVEYAVLWQGASQSIVDRVKGEVA